MNIKLLSVIAFMAMLVLACKKETQDYVPTCSGTKSFVTDVKPLIDAKCATSGCHNAVSHAGGHTLTTYDQIYAERTHIFSSVADGSMPEGSSLTDAQKDIILCWINQGALNN